jgi:arginyl-tRNA synthetase
MLLERYLDEAVEEVLKAALGGADDVQALIRPTQDARFGDYQVNGVLPIAKRRGENPRELAQKVAAALSGHEAIASAEVAGPGFVNLRLADDWLGRTLTRMVRDPERLDVSPVEAPETIVVDFSSPNIAKQMHVGHLRSTILGDALCRLLRFLGHRVIGDNHLGDWGTQFGLLIVGMREWGSPEALEATPIVELERVYKLASERSKEDEAFAESARQELKKLQSGDAENLALWRRFVTTTRAALESVYEELGVRFDEWLGESAYDERLPGVAQMLVDEGLAREDQGALCVFFGEIDGAPEALKRQKEPFIVRKRDGAFLYSTTDLATVLYRRDVFHADRSVYVVDVRQKLHFAQVFAVAKLLDVSMKLEHVGFGTVLGADGRPLRTRDASGNVVTLASLLDEAKARAAERIREGIAEGRLKVEEAEVDEVARAVGIGAVKYADLSNNRLSDYRFDLDKMTSFVGNSGPYLQYAYARSRSILRKGEVDVDALEGEAEVVISHEAEATLARRLLRFGDVVYRAAESYQPHLLCEHVYELSGAFNGFYQQCKVLDAETAEARASRLALTHLTGMQIKRALGLLGIDAVERM